MTTRGGWSEALHPRDHDGQFAHSGGGGSAWAHALDTRIATQAGVGVVLYHGTSPAAADRIRREGLHTRALGSNAGSSFGAGVYLSELADVARDFAGPSGTVLKLRTDVRAPVEVGQADFDRARIVGSWLGPAVDRARAGATDAEIMAEIEQRRAGKLGAVVATKTRQRLGLPGHATNADLVGEVSTATALGLVKDASRESGASVPWLVTHYLKQRGYDAIIRRTPDGQIDEMTVFDPSSIHVAG